MWRICLPCMFHSKCLSHPKHGQSENREAAYWFDDGNVACSLFGPWCSIMSNTSDKVKIIWIKQLIVMIYRLYSIVIIPMLISQNTYNVDFMLIIYVSDNVVGNDNVHDNNVDNSYDVIMLLIMLMVMIMFVIMMVIMVMML